MKNNVLFFHSVLTACLTFLQVSAQNTSPNWSLAGNSNATSSSKLGTTNAIPLRLFTNNSTRVYISSGGNVGVGTSSPSQKLHVSGNGYFTGKIGINTTPNYPLDIYNTSYNAGIVVNSFPSTNISYGIVSNCIIADGIGYGLSISGGQIGTSSFAHGGAYTGIAKGVEGVALGDAGTRYGVSGAALGQGGGGKLYGVLGNANGGAFNAAGYFVGDVYAYSYKTISDRKFKTGITPLTNSLEQLMKLKPSAYEFKTAEYAKMSLPKGKQIGLIADEVKQVFPELVTQAVHPGQYDKDNKRVVSPEEKYEGVNYQGFIPVLIASVQELKNENDQLKEEVAQLRQLVTDLKSGNTNSNTPLSSANLEQNAPNPFHSTTTIRYHLPSNVSKAQVVIMDLKGAVIKSIALNSKGSGQLSLNAGALSAGTYTYSLWVDGKPVDSKRMVVSR